MSADSRLPAVGTKVSVLINRQEKLGVVRYVGEAQFKEGIWVGLELDEPVGKNDGSIQGVRYFTCNPKHGIFALPKMLIPAHRAKSSPPERAKNYPAEAYYEENMMDWTQMERTQSQPGPATTHSPMPSGSTRRARKPVVSTPEPETHRGRSGKYASDYEMVEDSPTLGLDSPFAGARDGLESSWRVSRSEPLRVQRPPLDNPDVLHKKGRKKVDVKTSQVDATEKRDIPQLRLPEASMAMDLEQVSASLQHEVQRTMLEQQYEMQRELLDNHLELSRLLQDVAEGGDQESNGHFEQQVARVKAFERQVEAMQKSANLQASALNAQLEQMRTNSKKTLQNLEDKLQASDKPAGQPSAEDTDRDSTETSRGHVRVQVFAADDDQTPSTLDPRTPAESPTSKDNAHEVEELAYEQTLSPHYVLMGAEEEVSHSALYIAQQEANREASQRVLKATKFGAMAEASKEDLAAILGFIPNTLKRCIRNKLVYFQQWKVLLETPLKSLYNPILSVFEAAVVFADASGFTNLTETLARQENGAERIGETLNKFFGPIISLVHKHGGDVIKFSGDALTIIWASSEPAPTSYQGNVSDMPLSDREAQERAVGAAAVFCLEVQKEIPNIGKTSVSGCSLTMHIGVGFGQLALLQLGGLLGRWEYCVAGPALDQIAIAEPLALPGETVFSPEACDLAPEFKFAESKDEDAGPSGYLKLVGMSQDSEASEVRRRSKEGGLRRHASPLSGETSMPWWNFDKGKDLDLKIVRRYVPSACFQHFLSQSSGCSSGNMEEMRRLSVIFVSISGLDPFVHGGPDSHQDYAGMLSMKDHSSSRTQSFKTLPSMPSPKSAATSSEDCTAGFQKGWVGARETQLLMRLIQRSVYALEGSVNKFLVDDKGVLLLVVFGLPPLIHFADDPIRAVLCAMRVCDALRDEGMEGHIGVATGMCWCGVVGSNHRREYTVLGDVVNLSARLMGKAPSNGVLVDTCTQRIASDTLSFRDGGELRLKGKEKPVRAYIFTGIAQGAAGHKKALQTPLLSWRMWPARAALVAALQTVSHLSGVVYCTGPYGSGKSELGEEIRSWATLHGWTLLEGQNLDPSGTFTMPMLSLQQVFRKLGAAAKRDPFWREHGQELTSMSLGEGHAEVRPTGHTELYWILVAMLRVSSFSGAARCGDSPSDDQLRYSQVLEPWAPLLNLVVTQLAFNPNMIAAMQERNDQHCRHDRFAELCTGVLDGFSRFGSPERGTLVLINLRRSSGLLQRRDEREAAVIHSIADLCMRRRAESAPQARPVVLCIITPSEGFKDTRLEAQAQHCGCFVEASDLDGPQTMDYVEHLLQHQVPNRKPFAPEDSERFTRTPSLEGPSKRKQRTRAPRGTEVIGRSRIGIPRSCSSYHVGSSPRTPDTDGLLSEPDDGSPRRGSQPGRANLRAPSVTSHTASPRIQPKDPKEVLAHFVFEVTGGNIGEIEILMQDLERQEVLTTEFGKLVCVERCKSLSWLRSAVTLPEMSVGMAFTTFEQLSPAQKQVLKAASSIEGDFTVADLGAALPGMSEMKLAAICEELSQPSARTFRKAVVSKRQSQNQNPDIAPEEKPVYKFQFYSRVLRQASFTLVLECQRTIIRQRTSLSRRLHSRRLSAMVNGDKLPEAISEVSSDSDSETVINSYLSGSQALLHHNSTRTLKAPAQAQWNAQQLANELIEY